MLDYSYAVYFWQQHRLSILVLTLCCAATVRLRRGDPSPSYLALLYFRECLRSNSRLGLTTLDDGWWSVLVLDRTARATAGLDALDHAHGRGVAVRHGTEDDVATIKPASHDGGNEELGAVAIARVSSRHTERSSTVESLRVWASVRHGQHERLAVGHLEVLVCELLAVDGLATSTL